MEVNSTRPHQAQIACIGSGTDTMLPFVILTALAVAELLVAERRDWRAGVWIAKPLASIGFIAAALAAGALDTGYGCWILVGLVLSWFGDVFLIPRGAPRVFQAGVLSFLLGHVAYTIAFAVRGLDPSGSLLAALVLLAPVVLVVRWLLPHVEAEMKVPVYAYVVVISAMVVCAAGAVAAAAVPTILLGALMFYVSDLAVARERFVTDTFRNKLWGLPLYYGAQLVLASTVAS